MIYHIASRAAWELAQARGFYSAPSLEAEGFIHCSTIEQLPVVANGFYAGRRDLLLLCIHESRVNVELRWEAPAHPQSKEASFVTDTGQFPHIYGRLNLDAVVAVYDFPETDGGFPLPPELPDLSW